MLRRVFIIVIVVLSSSTAWARPGQQATAGKTGAELYGAACAACHGADGRGAPQSAVGFDTPLPDFTDCAFGSVEPDADWMAVSHDGGPARGFDRRMPAFGESLSTDDLQLILGHLRGFCSDRAWPRGELNMPRPFVTEKAFPENEAVLTTSVHTTGTGHVGNEFLYERRLGSRTQYEVAVPVLMTSGETGGWSSGLGDVAFAVKHVFMHNFDRGHILSAAGELILPTGKEDQDQGSGVTVFEPFVAFGQLLPSDGFVQLQAGLELPFDTAIAPREAFWRATVGKSFTQGRFGRSWSPMIEVLAGRDLEEGSATEWDLVPQMQVTLNTRQHLMINVGLRVPVNRRSDRPTQFLAYFLWDWFDGGLRDGW
jgi:hypothetical protein